MNSWVPNGLSSVTPPQFGFSVTARSRPMPLRQSVPIAANWGDANTGDGESGSHLVTSPVYFTANA